MYLTTAITIAIVMGLVVGLYAFWQVYPKDAPYVPLDKKSVMEVMKIAKVGKEDVFWDLGSGDGRVVIQAALAGATAYGVEIDWFRAVYSNLWIKVLGLSKKAKVVHGNLYKTDLSGATIVHTYLLEKANSKLSKKLKKELSKGTSVVASGFVFPWKPDFVSSHKTTYGPIRVYAM